MGELEDNLLSEEELEQIDENFGETEREGMKSILKYFDRIHDKLFNFNNIMIAGYFAMSALSDNISMFLILVPVFNLGILVFIEYRMMEKSRFDANIKQKTQEEIERNGRRIDYTNLFSLLTILSTIVVLGIFLYFLLSNLN